VGGFLEGLMSRGLASVGDLEALTFNLASGYFHSTSSNQFLGKPISFVCANGQVFINSLSRSLNVEPGLICFKTYSIQDNVA